MVPATSSAAAPRAAYDSPFPTSEHYVTFLRLAIGPLPGCLLVAALRIDSLSREEREL